MNWGRVDVSHVNDPASLVAVETGSLQMAGYAVTSEQVTGWLVKAVNADGEVAVAQLLIGPDIPPPPPQPFWLDGFTDADGTNLLSHASDIGNTYLKFPSSTGGATIQGGMVQADVSGASFFAVCQDLPTDGNYVLSAGIELNGAIGVAAYASLHGRLTPGQVAGLWNGYEARVSANAITLYRWTDAMPLELGSATWTPAAGILTLVCKKSVIAVQWNSAEVLAASDATYATGRVGFAIDGQGFRVDNAVGQDAL